MPKRNKAPKRVAGVKLPKRLRGPAGTLGQLSRNRIVSDLISTAIVAAAGAIVRSEAVRRLAKRTRRQANPVA